MKILKPVWILSLILFCALPLRAQWVIDLEERTQHLDSICAGSGHPLADGTEIRIYHDVDSDGPDDTDPLLQMCDEPPICETGPGGSVNYNTFYLNGARNSFAGGFSTQWPPIIDTIGSVSGVWWEPVPNRIYLRVCFGNRHYDSEILSPTGGGAYSQIEISSWTCVEAPCPGGPPSPPDSFRASDSTHCDSVRLSWRFSQGVPPGVDSVFFLRGTVPIGGAPASQTDTVFWDTTVPDATPYTYYAKSRRGTEYSSPAQNVGAKYPSPPATTMITATDDSCNAVRVTWTYFTTAGLDSFIIKRNGIRVGDTLAVGTPGTRSFIHRTTDSTRGGYTVVAHNPVCGQGTPSAVDSGRAKQPPLAPTGINATDGNCNTTRVSWNTVPGAVTYRVYRNTAGCAGTDVQIATVTAPDTAYSDGSSAAGTVFGYKVSAVNLCGEGPKSACDNGYRVTTVAQVTAVNATDGTSCDTVTITWNNLAQEDGYKIRRRKLSTGVLDTFTVPTDTVHYFDLSAVPGDTYYYRVWAYNICGNGLLNTTADSLGYRLAIPAQVQNVQATDSTQCARVTITWNNLSYEDSFQVRRSGLRIGKTLANVLTYQDSTGSVDSIYNYTVVAYNKCGWSTESAPNAGNRRRRPGLATGLAASDTGCTVIHLSWNALANTDSFRIIRNDTVRARVTGVTTSYNDNPAAGTYAYRILPWNSCGLGDTSVVVSGTRRAPPPAVATVTASDSVCGPVLVQWANVAGEDSFQVRRNGNRIGMVLTDVLSYSDTSASAVAGRRYKYEVVPYNACGYTSPAPSDSGTRHATPPPVTNVQASDSLYCWGVQITWHDSTDEDSFIVKRNGGRIGAKAKHVLSFDDSTAVVGTIYSYTVFAKNVCGLSTDSTTNPGNRKSRPGQATGLAATDTACANIRLTWNALANTDSFRIYRDGVILTRVTGATLTYTDVPAPGTYAYRILPWNTCGNGDTSAVESGTRLAQPPPVTYITASDSFCLAVRVAWGDVAGEDTFYVWRDSTLIGFRLANDTLFFDTTAVPGSRYKYRVFSHNFCGANASVPSDSGGRRAMPDPVVSIGGSFNSCDYIRITWWSVANVDSYIVFRNDLDTAHVPATDTSYVDSNATPGGIYRYFVKTKNACGIGLPSGEIGGMRLVFPSVPENLAATQDLCNFIRVTWDSAAGDVDSYRLIRDGTDSVTISGDSTGYNDVAVPDVHTYVIKAVSDDCGATEASAQASGERLVPAGVPANVQATNTRCDSIVITWDAAPGDVDGYIVYENGSPLDTVGPDTLRYACQPPVNSVRSYTVGAFSDQCGNGAMSSADNGVRLAEPTTVTGLTATVNRCDSVLLQWNAAGGTFDGYIVRRDTIALDTVDVLHYSDAAPVGSAQYDVITYSVYCDEPAPTAPVTGTRLPAPVSPDTVEATTHLCDSVVVTWNAGGGTFDEYRVYRHDTLRASLPVGVRHYAEAPRSGVTFMYSVTAWDSICGEAAVRDSAQGMRQADASVPQNLVAVNACDAVEVSWNTATGAVAEYRLYRNNMPLDTILPPDTTYSDTSAERGVTYAYAVSAYSTGCGETDSSNNDDGMRLPLPVQVTGLTASNNNCAGIRTDWTAVSGTEWYRIFRDGALIDSVSGTLRTTSYLDTGVVPRSTHSYKVRSVNICGEGALSDSVAGTRYDVPDAVTGFFASDTSCVAIYLIWQDVATDTAYVIYRDGSPIDTIPANSTSYVDTAAAPGAHTYVVKALNECGLSGASETADALRIPGVAQVTGVAATSGLCDRIVVTWSDLPNEDGYHVYRDTTLIATLESGDTDLDDSIGPGDIQPFLYCISGFNVCGEGQRSAAVTGLSATRPEPTTIQSATMDSCTSVTITWTDVATEQFYRVFRSDSLIATVDSNVTSYRDAPLSPGPYAYQVQSGNHCGNGQVSGVANGRVADVPDTVSGVAATNNGCTSITVTWADLTDELQYQILRNDTVIGTVPKDTLRYVDTTPAIGTHSYKVRGINICGQGALSAPATGERQGPPITAPVITVPDSACDTVRFSWTPVADITEYSVYRNGVQFGSASPEVTTLYDVNPGLGDRVGYSVRGINECGDGPLSNVDSVYFVPLPAQVMGVAADTMNCLTVTVTWNNVTSETGYRVLRGSAVVGTVAADTLRFVDSPLVGSYFYKVQAFNDCGSGVMSDSVMGRRRGAPASTSISASDTNCVNIVVSWTNVADELGYYVFQNGAPVDTVGTDTLSTTLTPPPGAYAYTVQPFNDCGLANISAPDSGHRLTIPPRVTGVAATSNRCDSIIVTWPDVLGETRYVVFRGADSIGFVNANVLRYADTTSVGSHGYRVRSDNQCGIGIPSDSVIGTRLAFPLAPIDVVATDTLCGQIRITWLSGGGDVDSFKVYRDDVLDTTVAANVFTHMEGITGTYAYRVVAHSNECGDSPTSLSDSGTGHVVAGVPTGVTFIAPEICDTVRLQWTASTGEVEKYMIYRDGALLDSSLITSYGDGNVPDAHNHTYGVSAKNAYCGESAQSDPATNGRVAYLMNPTGGDGDTLKCDSTYHLEMEFCLPVDSAVFYLSLRGGPFNVRVGSITPNTSPDTADVRLPLADSTIVSNCGILVIGYRGARIDSLPAFPLTIRCPEASTDENLSEIPKDFFLDQNYPNPFNPATNIRFGVPRAAHVTIEIFDILGRKMATLINSTMPPGIHTVTWDCSACPSGMYIIRMNTGERVLLRKTLLMK